MLEDFEDLSRDELIIIAQQMRRRLDDLTDRMIDKHQVAQKAGMSVSWLDNSKSSKAIRLRDTAIRYGKSHSSAVRYPLSEVSKICKQCENSLSVKFSAVADPNDQPTIASSHAAHRDTSLDYN